MSIDPAAQDVHPRRRHTYLDASGLNEGVKQSVYNRGVFEKMYGHPTDIDKVWADREALQKRRDDYYR